MSRDETSERNHTDQWGISPIRWLGAVLTVALWWSGLTAAACGGDKGAPAEPTAKAGTTAKPVVSVHDLAPTVEAADGMRFALVKPGKFMMGSPAQEPGRDDDEAQHEVSVDRPFYVGTTEVTQAQWRAVMGTNPSRFVGDDRPVESVTWAEAVEFAEKLSKRDGVTYRLPSEVEWEYACRAGTTTAYSAGAMLPPGKANIRMTMGAEGEAGLNDAWRKETQKVGSFPPNAWGLYDMHGNVWEWTAGAYAAYPGASPIVTEAGQKVLRGGAWNFSQDAARSAVRLAMAPERRYDCNGVRLVREVGGK